MSQRVLFAFGNRSNDYHHGDMGNLRIKALCDAGTRETEGARTWPTKDDVPTRLEECAACIKALAAEPKGEALHDGVAEPLGDCRTCGLPAARFPDGVMHEKPDGTFTVKGRGGCKAPAIQAKKPLPRVEEPKQVAEAQPESAPAEPPRPSPPVEVVYAPHSVPAGMEAVPGTEGRMIRPIVQATPSPALVAVLDANNGVEPTKVGWNAATIRHGASLLIDEASRGDWEEAVRTAEVLLFVAQRAKDRQATKK